MSLVADYSDTNSSSSSDSETSSESTQQIESKVASKNSLPSASSLFSQKAGEVFQNRYQQEEQAKNASLEHHVKMVENDEHLKTKNGLKICWNYRKGRCRFGSKCQYAHDSDLITDRTSTKEEPKSTRDQSDRLLETHHETRRKRPGLGDALTPGKRVMKAYKNQQQQS